MLLPHHTSEVFIITQTLPQNELIYLYWLECYEFQFHKDGIRLSWWLWLCFRFKFDDERVTKEDMKRALEEQYGGEEEVRFFYHEYHRKTVLLFSLNSALVWWILFHFSCLYPTVTTDKSGFQQYPIQVYEIFKCIYACVHPWKW